MSELGQQLREARLQKGMSLDDVQEMTKIRKRYLEAIEAGDYKVLPGSFYVRAFIKTYAEAVGLNPDELLEGHKQDVPKPVTESTMEPVIQKRASRSSSERNTSWLPTALMWIFPILIIAVIYYYAVMFNNNDPNEGIADPPASQEQPVGQSPGENEGEGEGGGQQPAEDPAEGEEPAGTEDPGSDEPVSNPEDNPGEGTGQDGENGEDGGDEPPAEQPAAVTVSQDRTEGRYTIFKVASTPGDPVKVEITASGQSWVEIYRGYNSQGENLYYGNMNAGDTFSGEMDAQGLYIKSAYSPATEIKIGGQSVSDGKTTSRMFFEPSESAPAGSEDTSEE
ncbi:helix-turn-helix domain-containing protein [Paenibacillus lemnae]|uniref:Helix-turn-helix domain-containing protein n=1 Tax=Paenibacillus lemnae TaxID=1330551 RepID=A0A848M827_PAELE|nr:helix-turn-helix domain-containing protein [Paenibacillus lemnae]NMO96232.1 helix-turn-helix domain-containing protein [Paenibacillus lemnae]